MMNLSKAFVVGCLLLFFCPFHSRAQIIEVHWHKVHQVIDGFGASDANNVGPMTSAQAALMFSPTTGVGLSLLRTAVPSDGSCSTVNATCAGKVSDMQLAIANGARVWSTPWSPPASMKSNGSVDNGGSLLADCYGAYATYLANYVKSLSTLYGINLYALSVQNEPEVSVYYASAIWSPSNFNTFIGSYLGPTFANGGLSPLIIMPETAIWQDLPAYADANMSDPTAAAYVSIYATHDYSHAGGSAYPIGQAEGKRLWETEVSNYIPGGKGTFDPSITSALKYAQDINDWMTIADANAWHYWELYGSNDDGEGLVDHSGTVSKRLYMMGNYSKFVRPGFQRIDATGTLQSGISVSAYKNTTTRTLVIVIINQNSSEVFQTFKLNGTNASSMIPWITSASFDLVQQSDVPVRDSSFTYSLPGFSITSFVASTTTSSESLGDGR